jgi:hypothetical protein
MDPNANLQEQERIISRNNPTVGRIPSEDRLRLRELRIALLAWIQGGGFSPRWEDCPNAAKYYGRGKG